MLRIGAVLTLGVGLAVACGSDERPPGPDSGATGGRATASGGMPDAPGGSGGFAAGGAVPAGGTAGAVSTGGTAGTGGAGVGGGGGKGGKAGCVPTVPSAELCDGVDNNCMNGADEGSACPDNCTGATLQGHYYTFCSFENASGTGTRQRTWLQAQDFCSKIGRAHV